MKNIFDSIKLNLGIKTKIRKIISKIKKIILKYRNLFDKLIYQINQKLNSYIYSRIIKHYGADYKWGDEKSQNLDKKRNNFGYGLFHYSIVRNQKPKRILCIGSMYGYIPFMITKACEENGIGKVDFVDADFNITEDENKGNHFFGQGFWGEVDTKDHFSYLLDPKFINTYLMKSEDFAKKYKNRKYDYIYLDGDHSYKGAKKDLNLFWPRLNKDGFLCFHDIHFDKTLEGVEFAYGKLWKEITKDKKWKFELSNHYSGLGILQKL